MRLRVEKTLGPHRRHLQRATDLETNYAATRAGFVSLALERNRQATPYVEEARALKVLASRASGPAQLARIPEIRPALLTAAGISGKAAGHMQDEDMGEAIQGLIAKFLEPAGAAFVEELVFRFLLTKGDTLGGSMRNIGGALAQRKLTRALLATLNIAGIPYQWLHSETRTWLGKAEDDADIEIHLRGLGWAAGKKVRTAIYNVTVPIVRKNIDLCLLDCTHAEIPAAYKEPSRYLALGELKGGIDPAGADEHWKTARTALHRITQAFLRNKRSPKTFFVGAAIAREMAKEIWFELEKGDLTNAANLTGPDQVTSLCRWLLDL
jgi:hypothetical protein